MKEVLFIFLKEVIKIQKIYKKFYLKKRYKMSQILKTKHS